MNAKNSYGGYVGMCPFIATLHNGKVVKTTLPDGRVVGSGITILGPSSDRVDQILVPGQCKQVTRANAR